MEIPAIPEDYDLLKNLLGKMTAIGVNILNLHQLNASRHNYRALLKRRYHFLHQSHVPVLESEMCALQLLIYAKENHIDLLINYCCSTYKKRFSGSAPAPTAGRDSAEERRRTYPHRLYPLVSGN